MIALSERDVRALLDMESCIAVMEQTLAELARGALYQPLRTVARPPGAGGFIGLMPAYRGGTRSVYALKEIVVTPDNPARGLDALNEGGDYGRAAADGAIGPRHTRAELGEVLAGQQAGRERRDELTVVKSYGIGVEDLAVAELVVRRARERRLGTTVEF